MTSRQRFDRVLSMLEGLECENKLYYKSQENMVGKINLYG